MTATSPTTTTTPTPPRRELGKQIVRVITTTDHKVIGNLYLDHVVRVVPDRRRDGAADPRRAGRPRACSSSTTRSTTSCSRCTARSCCCCSRPRCSSASRNAIMPLQIGAPDVAFPRLNMLSYWLFLFGGLIAVAGFLTPAGRGRLRLVRLHAAVRRDPLARRRRRPVDHGPGDGRPRHDPRRGQLHHDDHLHARARHDDVPDADLHLEHPGHRDAGADRVPGAAPPRCSSLEADRRLGAHVFDPPTAAPILWQHLFWFFGHPEVYIIALPFFGIITEILPVFSRKPIFGYIGLVCATLGIAALSVAVWAHHMFVTGAVLLPFFSVHDVADRRADRGEVLQLDRHDVGRIDLPSTPPCCGRSASSSRSSSAA